MVPNERVANKLLSIFADASLTDLDIDRVAFYTVVNAKPHYYMLDRLRMYTEAVAYHERTWTEYDQISLF